jgi:TatD DNase family protein
MLNTHYIDIHTHYEYKEYEKLKEIYNSEKIIGLCSSVDIETYKDLLQLQEKNIKNLYFSYGLYPDTVIKKTIDECLEEINKINFSKGIAVGEIGLDNKITKDLTKREEQKKLFKKQLEIAEQKKLPVVIHSRYATKKVMEILDGYNNKVILHWFSGSEKEIEDAFNRGYYLTINFDRTNIHITKNNIQQIFIETDYPVPYNNISKITNIKEAYKIIANKNNLNINYLKEQIQNNFIKLFKIKI